MRSGSPEPAADLRLIIDAKRNSPSRTCEIVSETTRWLKSELKGAKLSYQYSECEEEDHYGFAAFTLVRRYKGSPVALNLKVAEIKDTPHAFAEIMPIGKAQASLFPYYGELSSDEGRLKLMHYIADFALSTTE